MSTSVDAQTEDQVLLTTWVKNQDQAAFELLVERYAPVVNGVCLRSWNGDKERADEACQAVFIIFAQKASSIRDANHIGSWLHRCAVNTVNTQRRVEKRQHKLKQTVQEEMKTIPTLTDHEQAQWQEMRPLLDKGIDALSNKLRESIVLHYYQGQSVKDIANTLSTSESAVKKRLHEGRNRLRAYFTRAGYTASLAFMTAALQAETVPTCSINLIATCYQASAPLHIPAANGLAQGVLKSMIISKIKIAASAALVMVTFSAAAVYAADANGNIPSTPNQINTVKTPSANANGAPSQNADPAGGAPNTAHKQSNTNGNVPGTAFGQQNGAGIIKVDENGNRIHIKQDRNANGAQVGFGGATDPNAANPSNANSQRNGNVQRRQGSSIRVKIHKNVSTNFVDTPLKDVITYISTASDVNIVLGNNIDANQKITLKVSDQKVRDVLTTISTLYNLTYTIKNNALYMTSKSNTTGNKKTENVDF